MLSDQPIIPIALHVRLGIMWSPVFQMSSFLLGLNKQATAHALVPSESSPKGGSYLFVQGMHDFLILHSIIAFSDWLPTLSTLFSLA